MTSPDMGDRAQMASADMDHGAQMEIADGEEGAPMAIIPAIIWRGGASGNTTLSGLWWQGGK
jgi:hypothetical protein